VDISFYLKIACKIFQNFLIYVIKQGQRPSRSLNIIIKLCHTHIIHRFTSITFHQRVLRISDTIKHFTKCPTHTLSVANIMRHFSRHRLISGKHPNELFRVPKIILTLFGKQKTTDDVNTLRGKLQLISKSIRNRIDN